jgi:hypothetical protein
MYLIRQPIVILARNKTHRPRTFKYVSSTRQDPANFTRKASPAPLELRRIPLHPTHDRCMRKMQPTFGHHLNQITKAELVT